MEFEFSFQFERLSKFQNFKFCNCSSIRYSEPFAISSNFILSFDINFNFYCFDARKFGHSTFARSLIFKFEISAILKFYITRNGHFKLCFFFGKWKILKQFFMQFSIRKFISKKVRRKLRNPWTSTGERSWTLSRCARGPGLPWLSWPGREHAVKHDPTLPTLLPFVHATGKDGSRTPAWARFEPPKPQLSSGYLEVACLQLIGIYVVKEGRERSNAVAKLRKIKTHTHTYRTLNRKLFREEMWVNFITFPQWVIPIELLFSTTFYKWNCIGSNETEQ